MIEKIVDLDGFICLNFKEINWRDENVGPLQARTQPPQPRGI